MKRFILILLGISVGLTTKAQSNLYFNNYWQETYLINPASIDPLGSDWRLGLGSRTQWLLMPGAPITGQLAAMYCNEAYNLQTGFSIITDKIGYTYSMDIALSYAYIIFMGNAQLNLGTSLHWQNLFYDKSQIITEDEHDPYIIDLYSDNWWKQGRINSDFGIEYSWNSSGYGTVLLGAVSKNFIPSSVFSSDLDIFPNTNYLYGRFNSDNRNALRQSRNIYNFDYSVALIGIHTSLPQKPNFLQGIANVNVHWNYEDYIFTTGLLYSTKSDLGFILGLDIVYNFSASLIYQYNWRVRTDIFNPVGTIELVLTYRIKPKGADKPCKKGGICLPARKVPRAP
ncbi:MAG: type IX secretion system membrane protein PorP/SprF [Bacteroidales bacterium]|nr:type IX secretion system membrane protein PorP/SprF [Bacteroidales bacterium]MCL2132860.1 type IX secretion system membrane protein PorP/SprF [Bacteroidales bacterium]